jgi:hypothetical protein
MQLVSSDNGYFYYYIIFSGSYAYCPVCFGEMTHAELRECDFCHACVHDWCRTFEPFDHVCQNCIDGDD